MNEQIKDLLETRKKKDFRLGYITPAVIDRYDNLTIISRKGLFGLADSDGRFIFPPVYDEITFMQTCGLVKIKISDKIALFSVKDQKLITDYECDEILSFEAYGAVEFVIEGKHGLWGCEQNRILIPAKYEDVTCRTECEYLWAYSDSHFYFIESKTGRIISISNAMNVYDTEKGMFIQFGETGNVVYLNSDGFRDTMTLRRLVMKNNGRLTLRNSKRNLKDVIDIYGRILNN